MGLFVRCTTFRCVLPTSGPYLTSRACERIDIPEMENECGTVNLQEGKCRPVSEDALIALGTGPVTIPFSYYLVGPIVAAVLASCWVVLAGVLASDFMHRRGQRLRALVDTSPRSPGQKAS